MHNNQLYRIVIFTFTSALLLSNCRKDTTPVVPRELTLSIQQIGAFDTLINECSGFFYDQAQLFVINDGGGGAVLYQMDPENLERVTAIPLEAVQNIDWEAIEITSDEIIIGDFGNNWGIRKNLSLLHFDKNTYEFKNKITFSFPNQSDFFPSDSHNFDSEAFFVKDEQYHLFTKNRGNSKTNLYTAPVNTNLFELRDSIEVPAFVTDVYYYEAKEVILLLGNQFVEDKFESSITIIQIQEDSGLVRLDNIALNIKEQLEAITLKEDNVFFVGSEKERNGGGNLYEVQINGL